MRRVTYILLICLFLPFISRAQISGVVYELVDGEQKPLFQANVYWANSTIGTTSDLEGRFEIENPKKHNQLVFSFIGYQSDTITINSSEKQEIKVILRDAKFLGQVEIAERRVGSHYSRLETLNVQNISGAELGKAACCNLSESFETNASVDASYSDATTGAKQIRLLGLARKYVQIMTENIPNLYGLSQPYALVYVPGPWMESIQISKGTSTVMNGYESLTGQINIEYKKPISSDYFFFNQLFTSAGRSETNMDAAIKLNERWSTMIFAHNQLDIIEKNPFGSKSPVLSHDHSHDHSGTHNHSHSHGNHFLDHNGDGFFDHPKVKQYNIFNRWDYFGDNKTVRFGVKYINEERQGGQTDHNFKIRPTLDTKTYGVSIKTQRAEGFVKMGYVFPGKPYRSIAAINNLTYHKQDSYYGHRIYDATQFSEYFNLIWQDAFAGNTNHNYNLGFNLKYEDIKQKLDQVNYNDLEIVPGAYFQYTGKFGSKFNLIAGIRADHHNEFGLKITPRLHLKYNINGNLIFKLSAGKGYRKANVLAENSYLLASSRKIEIADNLRMEDAWNFGANMTSYIPIGDKNMTVNLEFYRTEFLNQIITDFENVDFVRFYNLNGKSYSNTFQIDATYQLFRGFEMLTAFRYNDVKQTFGGVLKESPLVNKFKGLLTLSYKTPLETWQFDFTSQLNGYGRIPSTAENPERFRRDTKFPSHPILNAQVTKFFRNWELYAGAENLLNFRQQNPIIDAGNPYGDYFDSSLIWGPIHGTKFYLGVRYNIKNNSKKSINTSCIIIKK